MGTRSRLCGSASQLRSTSTRAQETTLSVCKKASWHPLRGQIELRIKSEGCRLRPIRRHDKNVRIARVLRDKSDASAIR